MYLNQEEIEKFEQDGFLVLKDFVSQDACEALSHRATEIVKAFDPAESVSIFTTNKQTRHSDRYFLESGDKIRCFLKRKPLMKMASCISQNPSRSTKSDMPCMIWIRFLSNFQEPRNWPKFQKILDLKIQGFCNPCSFSSSRILAGKWSVIRMQLFFTLSR